MTKIDPDTTAIKSDKTYQVTLVSPEHGSYTLCPQLPADGRVPAGTELSISARPKGGYSLDTVYYTMKARTQGRKTKTSPFHRAGFQRFPYHRADGSGMRGGAAGKTAGG